jgi:hypothetical protein
MAHCSNDLMHVMRKHQCPDDHGAVRVVPNRRDRRRKARPQRPAPSWTRFTGRTRG